MKRTLLALLLLSFSLSAQQFQWLQTPTIDFGMNAGNIGYPVKADGLGNIFMSGFKDAEMPYGANILGNIFVNKYDANGALVFSKTINGNVAVFQMETDSQGNVLLVLGWRDGIVLDNEALLTAAQGLQPLLVKLDASGNVLWHHEPVIDDWTVQQFYAVTLDASDNIYVGYGDYNDTYIDKLSPAGVKLSSITQENVSLLASLAVDTAGNLYAAGSCAEINPSFGGTAASTNLAYNVYLAKYNPSGQNEWVKFVEDITCSSPLVKVRNPDEVYFSSELNGNFSLGSIQTEGPGFSQDFFLARLDASGAFLWVREAPGSGNAAGGGRNALTLDADGNAFLVGSSRGNVQWSPSIATAAAGFTSDVLILKYDPNGTILFAKTAGGPNQDRADGISIGTDGSAYVSGMTNGNSAFDDLTQSGEQYVYYPFLTKLNTTLSLTENSLEKLSWFPNPAVSEITFEGNVPVSGRILTTLGQTVKSFSVNPGERLPVVDLANGMYVIQAAGFRTAKLVKQ